MQRAIEALRAVGTPYAHKLAGELEERNLPVMAVLAEACDVYEYEVDSEEQGEAWQEAIDELYKIRPWA